MEVGTCACGSQRTLGTVPPMHDTFIFERGYLIGMQLIK